MPAVQLRIKFSLSHFSLPLTGSPREDGVAGITVSRGFGGNDLAISPTNCVVFVRFVNINVSIDAVVLLAVRYAWTAGRLVNDTHFVWRVVT